jgi:ABC-2 type transport system permease protein
MKWKLTLACLKMFFREKEAVFWTMFFPVFIVILFGFVKFDKFGSVKLGVVNGSDPHTAQLIQSLKQVKTLDVHLGLRQDEMKALAKGERDLVLIVPESNGPEFHAYVNDAKPQEAELGSLLVERVLDEASFHHKGKALKTEPVHGRKLRYMDFLLPGILSMSIMQMGIFSVAFFFVDLKKRGVLRRLRVTPMRPNDFILAQVTTRLVVLMMQIVLLIAIGILFFHLNFAGSLWRMFLVGVLGAIVFLAIGFAIAGVSKSEDQVAPLANVVTLPMLLLSGIFFGRENLPGFVHAITNYFPLTFLADAMRSIAIDGATLHQLFPQIAGLIVWCTVSCLMAVKLFRWE